MILVVVLAGCGGSRPRSAPVATSPGASDRRGELERLDRELAADLARLELPPPAPPDGAQPASAALELPLPTKDPSCKRGVGQRCTDTCDLADAICTSAGKICEIAAELGDDHAKGKCTSGKASCDAARAKCCGCLP
jgi:hypothetical protein